MADNLGATGQLTNTATKAGTPTCQISAGDRATPDHGFRLGDGRGLDRREADDAVHGPHRGYPPGSAVRHAGDGQMLVNCPKPHALPSASHRPASHRSSAMSSLT
jgi:hypothetical protein